jgi:hypothetical protein
MDYEQTLELDAWFGVALSKLLETVTFLLSLSFRSTPSKKLPSFFMAYPNELERSPW